MNELLKLLEKNPKIHYIEKYLEPSLSDEDIYKELNVILKSTRPLYDHYKSIHIKPSHLENKYDIVFISNTNPVNTLLKPLYLKLKINDWKRPRYAHENPKVSMRVSIEELNKVINYYYSSINY